MRPWVNSPNCESHSQTMRVGRSVLESRQSAIGQFFVTSNSPRSLSLRAGSSGWSSSGEGKGRRACNYVAGIWISASKRRCETLIGRDVISNDFNTLKWHVFFNVCLLAFLLISAWRWLAEIWQLSKWGATGELEVEFKFQRRGCKLSFLFPPLIQSTLGACIQATEIFIKVNSVQFPFHF